MYPNYNEKIDLNDVSLYVQGVPKKVLREI